MLLGVSFCFFSTSSNPSKSWVKIPVFFTIPYEPLIHSEIENIPYSLLVDLGGSRSLYLKETNLKNLSLKKWTQETQLKDIKGNVYLSDQYQVPKVKIGPLEFQNVEVVEEKIEFSENNIIWNSIKNTNPNRKASKIDGSIGCPLFQNYCCLFDFPNSAIYLGKSFDKDISHKNFVKVPFTLEKYGVVLSVETDQGLHRFSLDTGAGFSVIRNSLIDKMHLKELGKGTNRWYFQTKKMTLDGYNFGQWEFALYPIAEEFDIDGSLGIDFFKEHAIYLDFSNRIAYIKKPEKWPIPELKRLKHCLTQYYFTLYSRI